MNRPDLVALTPEALAALTNLGLVKRAQREIQAGAAPATAEDADGTVTGTFTDGVVTRLPPHVPLKSAVCTCGAKGACRHVLATVLGYQAQATSAPLEAAPAPEPPSEAWSPAAITDDELGRALGPKIMLRAQQSLRRSFLVTLAPESPPTAKLPSCTVRFLVPRNVAYAKCDCVLAGAGCEHVALAVWAFREAPAAQASVVVTLGRAAVAEASRQLFDELAALLRELLLAGVAQAAPPAQAFAQLRHALDQQGMVWLHGALADLQAALEGYAARSALHGVREILALILEVAARLRAASSDDAELPPRFVLGEDAAPETRLDHVRLVSLGARVFADERARFADVFLADPDTASCMVLRKRWDFPEGADLEEGPRLARRNVASGVTLGALASGQVISKAVSRQANGTCELGRARGQTSVTPQQGDCGRLPAPLLITDLEARAAATKHLPPRFLRPRLLAENMHVVAVSKVEDAVYVAAEQTLRAYLRDAADRPFEMLVRYRRATPHAIEATAATLGDRLRFVAGALTSSPAGWELAPTALWTDSLVVPDIAGPVTASVLPPGRHLQRRDALDVALESAQSCLDELGSLGLRAPKDAALARLGALAARLDDLGAAGLALRLRTLGESARSRSAGSVTAWLDVGLRLALWNEAVAG